MYELYYLHKVKSTVKILLNFLAFLENINFTVINQDLCEITLEILYGLCTAISRDFFLILLLFSSRLTTAVWFGCRALLPIRFPLQFDEFSVFQEAHFRSETETVVTMWWWAALIFVLFSQSRITLTTPTGSQSVHYRQPLADQVPRCTFLLAQ